MAEGDREMTPDEDVDLAKRDFPATLVVVDGSEDTK
jgi:hypothetical protein